METIAKIKQELGSYKPEMLEQYNIYMSQTFGIGRECKCLDMLRKDFTSERDLYVICKIEEYCKDGTITL